MTKSPIRYANVDPAMIAAVRGQGSRYKNSPTDEATPSMVMADYLQDNGIPGAHIVRAHGERATRGESPKSQPHGGRTTTTPFLFLGNEPRSTDHVSMDDAISRIGPDGDFLPITFGQGIPGSHVYEMQVNHAGESGDARGGVTHQAFARSWPELHTLISDFPEWARKAVITHARTVLGPQRPRKIKDELPPLPSRRLSRRPLRYAVIGGSTPTINVQVPVPTPAAMPRQPRPAPDVPPQPIPQAAPPSLQPVPSELGPVPPGIEPPQATAFILPWRVEPEQKPQQMRRLPKRRLSLRRA